MISGWRPSIIFPVVVLLAVVLVAAIIAVPDSDDLPAPAPTTPDPGVACGELARDMATTMQRFVDQFEGADVSTFLSGARYPQAVNLTHESAEFQSRAGALGCSSHELSDVLVAAVAGVRGDGPLARVLAANLRASVQRELHDTDGAAETSTRRLEPGEDLAEAAAELSPGSRLVLEPGDHVLDQTLVLLHAIELVGDGADTTRIVSRAEGSAVLALGAGVLTLTDVTLEHTGSDAVDLLVVASGEFRVRGSRLAGAVRDDRGLGGTALVAATVEAALDLVPGTTPSPAAVRELIDTEVVGNDGEGVTLLGGPTATLAGVTFRDNGSCGLCLLGSSASVERAEFLDNRIGVAVVRGGALDVRDVVFRGNAEAGIAFEDGTEGSVTESTFEDNGAVGLTLNGSAAPTVTGSTFLGHEGVALAVSGDAAPTIEGNRFEDNQIAMQLSGSSGATVRENVITGPGRVGLLVGDESSGRVSANEITGSLEVGIQLQDAAATSFDGNRLRTSGRVGALFLDRARGSVDGMVVDGQEIAIQVRDDAAPTIRSAVLLRYERLAMVYSGRAGGAAIGNRCLSPGIGVLLLEEAQPRLEDNDCRPLDLRG